MITKVETGFYIKLNVKEKLYNIESPSLGYVGTIYRTCRYKTNEYSEMVFSYVYELELSKVKTFTNKERNEINLLYHNIVNVLTYDIRNVFNDDINERLNVPFYKEKYKLVLA